MTTLNPMRPFGTSAIIAKSDIRKDWTYLAAAGHYKTADVLAAAWAAHTAWHALWNWAYTGRTR